MADLHNDCAPLPPDVKEVLEKGENEIYKL